MHRLFSVQRSHRPAAIERVDDGLGDTPKSLAVAAKFGRRAHKLGHLRVAERAGLHRDNQTQRLANIAAERHAVSSRWVWKSARLRRGARVPAASKSGMEQ